MYIKGKWDSLISVSRHKLKPCSYTSNIQHGQWTLKVKNLAKKNVDQLRRKNGFLKSITETLKLFLKEEREAP